ncbi:hypothetical protein chiPu_0031574, partial [Chiloscyllium punctatum]|nr:hypothetical protein [Chiloscyllium punctatum]
RRLPSFPRPPSSARFTLKDANAICPSFGLKTRYKCRRRTRAPSPATLGPEWLTEP